VKTLLAVDGSECGLRVARFLVRAEVPVRFVK